MKSFLKEFLITLGLALVIYLLMRTTVQTSIVNYSSMQPTLVADQRLIVVKAVYFFSEPSHGDIIIIRPPIAPDEEWVKRLIGLPGDTIEVKNGTVYVNDCPLDEPYIKEKPTYTLPRFTVPEGRYFVLGDNRNNSTDSHLGWTVTRDEIIGKACLRIWPFNKWGFVGNYPLDEQITPAKTASVDPGPATDNSAPEAVN